MDRGAKRARLSQSPITEIPSGRSCRSSRLHIQDTALSDGQKTSGPQKPFPQQSPSNARGGKLVQSKANASSTKAVKNKKDPGENKERKALHEQGKELPHVSPLLKRRSRSSGVGREETSPDEEEDRNAMVVVFPAAATRSRRGKGSGTVEEEASKSTGRKNQNAAVNSGSPQPKTVNKSSSSSQKTTAPGKSFQSASTESDKAKDFGISRKEIAALIGQSLSEDIHTFAKGRTRRSTAKESQEYEATTEKQEKAEKAPGMAEKQTLLQGKTEKQALQPGKAEKQTSLPGKAEKQTSLPGKAEKQTSLPGKAEKQTSLPGKAEKQTSSPGKAEKQTSLPGKAEKQSLLPGKAEKQTSSPGKAEKQTSSPGKAEKQTSLPGKVEKQSSLPGKAEKQTSLFGKASIKVKDEKRSPTPDPESEKAETSASLKKRKLGEHKDETPHEDTSKSGPDENVIPGKRAAEEPLDKTLEREKKSRKRSESAFETSWLEMERKDSQTAGGCSTDTASQESSVHQDQEIKQEHSEDRIPENDQLAEKNDFSKLKGVTCAGSSKNISYDPEVRLAVRLLKVEHALDQMVQHMRGSNRENKTEDADITDSNVASKSADITNNEHSNIGFKAEDDTEMKISNMRSELEDEAFVKGLNIESEAEKETDLGDSSTGSDLIDDSNTVNSSDLREKKIKQEESVGYEVTGSLSEKASGMQEAAQKTEDESEILHKDSGIVFPLGLVIQDLAVERRENDADDSDQQQHSVSKKEGTEGIGEDKSERDTHGVEDSVQQAQSVSNKKGTEGSGQDKSERDTQGVEDSVQQAQSVSNKEGTEGSGQDKSERDTQGVEDSVQQAQSVSNKEGTEGSGQDKLERDTQGAEEETRIKTEIEFEEESAESSKNFTASAKEYGGENVQKELIQAAPAEECGGEHAQNEVIQTAFTGECGGDHLQKELIQPDEIELVEIKQEVPDYYEEVEHAESYPMEEVDVKLEDDIEGFEVVAEWSSLKCNLQDGNQMADNSDVASKSVVTTEPENQYSDSFQMADVSIQEQNTAQYEALFSSSSPIQEPVASVSPIMSFSSETSTKTTGTSLKMAKVGTALQTQPTQDKMAASLVTEPETKAAESKTDKCTSVDQDSEGTSSTSPEETGTNLPVQQGPAAVDLSETDLSSTEQTGNLSEAGPLMLGPFKSTQKAKGKKEKTPVVKLVNVASDQVLQVSAAVPENSTEGTSVSNSAESEDVMITKVEPASQHPRGSSSMSALIEKVCSIDMLGKIIKSSGTSFEFGGKLFSSVSHVEPEKTTDKIQKNTPNVIKYSICEDNKARVVRSVLKDKVQEVHAIGAGRKLHYMDPILGAKQQVIGSPNSSAGAEMAQIKVHLASGKTAIINLKKGNGLTVSKPVDGPKEKYVTLPLSFHMKNQGRHNREYTNQAPIIKAEDIRIPGLSKEMMKQVSVTVHSLPRKRKERNVPGLLVFPSKLKKMGKSKGLSLLAMNALSAGLADCDSLNSADDSAADKSLSSTSNPGASQSCSDPTEDKLTNETLTSPLASAPSTNPTADASTSDVCGDDDDSDSEDPPGLYIPRPYGRLTAAGQHFFDEIEENCPLSPGSKAFAETLIKQRDFLSDAKHCEALEKIGLVPITLDTVELLNTNMAMKGSSPTVTTSSSSQNENKMTEAKDTPFPLLAEIPKLDKGKTQVTLLPNTTIYPIDVGVTNSTTNLKEKEQNLVVTSPLTGNQVTSVEPTVNTILTLTKSSTASKLSSTPSTISVLPYHANTQLSSGGAMMTLPALTTTTSSTQQSRTTSSSQQSLLLHSASGQAPAASVGVQAAPREGN